MTGSTETSTSLPASDCQTGTGFLKTCFKHSAVDAAWSALDGDFKQTGGFFGVNDATVFQPSGSIIEANGGGLVWTAPEAGPFQGLALWSETSSTRYSLSGSGELEMLGTFFTPNANPISLSGGSGLQPQRAQFVARRLKISGGGSLQLLPHDLKLIEIPPPAAVLIR
jgi:hypothetical protein